MAEINEDLSEEQQLKIQLESKLEELCDDYQKLFESSTMAPKGTGSKKTDVNAEQINDDDFEEIADVADNLDSLASALDMIEERADRIREQLLELLTSNREIRQSIREENDKLRACQSNEQTEPNGNAEPENNEPKDQ